MRWIVVFLLLAGCVDPEAVSADECPAGFCFDPIEEGIWHSPGYWQGIPIEDLQEIPLLGHPVQDVVVADGVAWIDAANITSVTADGEVQIVPYILDADTRVGAEIRLVDDGWWFRDVFERTWRTPDGGVVESGPGDWFQVRQEGHLRSLIHSEDGIASPVATSAYPLAVETGSGLVWTEDTGGGSSRVMMRDAAGTRELLETDFDVTHMVASGGGVAVWGHTCPVDSHCGYSRAVPVHWVDADARVITTGDPADDIVVWRAVHVDGTHILNETHVLGDDGASRALAHPLREFDHERGVAWGIDGARLWVVPIDDLLQDCCN